MNKYLEKIAEFKEIHPGVKYDKMSNTFQTDRASAESMTRKNDIKRVVGAGLLSAVGSPLSSMGVLAHFRTKGLKINPEKARKYVGISTAAGIGTASASQYVSQKLQPTGVRVLRDLDKVSKKHGYKDRKDVYRFSGE